MSTEKSQLDKTYSSFAAANDVGEIITPQQLSMPAVPIQRVASGKTNTEELQSEKDQHSINGVEERILASYSSVPPDDDGSNGQNKGNALQGKFYSPNPLQFKIPKSTLKSFSAPPLQFKNNTIQKQSEEEEPVQGKFNTIQKQSEEEEPVQAKSSNPNGLPGTVQAQMENALGADFSNVNIHTNSKSATDVGALAYTQGNDVHFAPGQYNPESSSGQELIGHELTHVVQQREGRVQPTTQAKGLPVNDDKGLEAEADAGGQKAVQMKNKTAQLRENGTTEDLHNQIYGEGTNHHPSTPIITNINGTNSSSNSNNLHHTSNINPTTNPQTVNQQTNSNRNQPRRRQNEHQAPSIQSPSDQNNTQTSQPTPTNATSTDSPSHPTPQPRSRASAVSTDISSQSPQIANPRTPTRENPSSGVDWAGFWRENHWNLLRSGLEVTRLVPLLGLPLGMGADVCETISDLESANPANDNFINMLIILRSPVVLVNNVLGHLLYVDELVQDFGVASVVGIELTALTAPVAESLASMKLGVQGAQTVIDVLVLAKSTMGMRHVPANSAEFNAYRSVFSGYDANVMMDGLEFILTGLDTGSAGFAQGGPLTQAAKLAKTVFKNKNLWLRLGSNFIKTLVGIWGGGGIERTITPNQPSTDTSQPPNQSASNNNIQRKTDPLTDAIQLLSNDSGASNVEVRRVAAQIINNEITLMQQGFNLGTAVINSTANGMDEFMAGVNKASQALSGKDAIPLIRDGLIRGINNMDNQLQGVLETQPFITDAQQKTEQLKEYLNSAETAINKIQLPHIQLPDSPVPDFIENQTQRLMNGLISQLNSAINRAKTEGIQVISHFKSKASEIAEFLQIVVDILREQIDFIRTKLAELRQLLSKINSLEDVTNILLNEVSSILGIDPPLSAESIREGWSDFQKDINRGFNIARNLVTSNIEGR